MSTGPKRKLLEAESAEQSKLKRPASPEVSPKHLLENLTLPAAVRPDSPSCSRNHYEAVVELRDEHQVLQQFTLPDHKPESCSIYESGGQYSQLIKRPMSPLLQLPSDFSKQHIEDFTQPALECSASPISERSDDFTVGSETEGFLSVPQSTLTDHGSKPSLSDDLNRPVSPLLPGVHGPETMAPQAEEQDIAPPSFTCPPELSTFICEHQQSEPDSLLKQSEPDWLPPLDKFNSPEHWDPEQELEDKNDDGEFYSLDADPPIYKGAPITLKESLVSILTMALQFSLSGMCIQALLKLLELHCLKEDNVMKSSLYLFKKYFSHLRGAVDYEYFCSKCFSKCEKSTGCEKCVGVKTQLCCLIKIPMTSQLQTLMKRKGFSDALDFNKKQCSSGLADISDGQLFQDHFKLGILGNGDTLTTNWYTDGAALFKSSKVSVWPMCHSINELPYSQRFQKENLLVSAIWCGPVQPPGNIILNAIYPELMHLKNGVNLDIEGKGVKNIKVIVLGGTGDTPARSLMMNMVKHNGEHSCQKCEQKGECREGFPGVRVFPFRPDEMKPRSDDSLEQQGNIARVTGSAYVGVKGNTLLTKISSSAIRGTAIDSMHLIFSGIGKTNIKFFVDTSFHKLKCNVGKSGRSLITERLLSIKPPHYLTRVPKPLEEFAVWKTSLHKSMLLYFSLAVFHDVVPTFHLKHFASLVAAVYFLNSDSPTPDCLEKANLLINKYVSYFEDFYGREYMTLSVHLLLHLVELVKEIGPLWTTACFPLEGVLGEILKLVHGTRHAEKQISSSLQMCLGLRDLVDNLPEGSCKEFCEDLLTPTNKVPFAVIGGVAIFGSWRKLSSLPEFLKEPLSAMRIQETGLFTFDCLEKNKMLYAAESYTRSSSRDSSCVEFTTQGKNDIGIIKFFLRSANCSCLKCSCDCKLFAVIERLLVVDTFKTLVPEIDVPNIHKYERSNVCLILPLTCLGNVCIKMEFHNKLFVAKRCNSKEIE